MMRITTNPAFLTERLRELDWDPQHIQLVYDRLIHLAELGECPVTVSKRLNPLKATTAPFEDSPALRGRLRGSEQLNWELQAKIDRRKRAYS